MKFPRSAKIYRGQLDAAPFAGVFFLLVLFVLLASVLYTPGVRINLPAAEDLPGTDNPTFTVAVDHDGKFYFEYQLISGKDLKARLGVAAKKNPERLTLVVQADKTVNLDTIINLTLLAREAGIREALLATLPPAFEKSPSSP